MKKHLLSFSFVAFLFIFISFEAQAQKISIGGQGVIGVPLGDFGKTANTGFGLRLNALYFLKPQLALGVNISLNDFSGKESVGGVSINYGLVEFAGSVRYFLKEEGFRPYGFADIGYYSERLGASGGGGVSINVDASNSVLGVAAGAGFVYDITEKWGIDVNAKYNMIFADQTLHVVPISVGIIYTMEK